jgi:acetyl-CoA carboxylase biotin carboxyl carrier protein
MRNTPGDRRAEVAALVRELLARLEREDLTELTLTRGDLRVRVRRDERPAVRATAARGAEGALPERPGSEPAAASEVVEVKAPLTGVFYRAPSPQAQPYVQVGSTVSVGEVIGLIEAMKLFNEIRSTAAGRVRRIFVEGGQFVRAHAPLLEVEPL